MSNEQDRNLYRIFLLTIWQEDEETWRFQLEDPRSGKRRGFAGIESLVDGLHRVMDRQALSPEQSDPFDSAQSPGC